MKSEKKIYQLLNQTKNNLSQYEEENISYFEKQKFLENVKARAYVSPPKKNNSKPSSLIIVAIIFLLLVGSQTPVGKKVQGAVYSFLETIHYSLSEALGNNRMDSSEALSINQTAVLENAQVKVGDLLMFDDRIIVNLLIELDKTREEKVFSGMEEFQILLNGNPLIQEPGSGIITNYDSSHNVYSMVYTAYLEKETTLPQNILMDIYIKNIYFYHPSVQERRAPVEKGKAHFSIETKAEDLTAHTKQYAIQKNIQTGEYSFTINSLIVHPLISFFKVSSENWGEEYPLIEIRGTDGQGHKVVFTPDTYRISPNQFESTYHFSEKASEITLEELTKTESLKLQFYSAGHPEGTEAVYKAYGEPFVIKLK